MKKNILSYLFFILAFSGFVFLRIFAGKNLAESKGEAVAAVNRAEDEVNRTIDEVYPHADGSGTDSKADESNVLTETDNGADDEKHTGEEESAEAGILNDEWRGDFSPIEPFNGELPRIVCWGDSLTSSYDKRTAYPDVLRDITGCDVVNYGVESENTKMIAMRQGGVRVNVKATVIPSECQMIPIFLRTEDDGHVFYLDNGDEGVNPCSICGIEGTLEKINGAYYFTRSSKGERISVPEGTQFKTFGMNDAKEDDVLVIFTGTNDMPDSDSVYEVIRMQRAMIEAAGCERYLVIGMTYAGGMPEIDTVNEILANEYEDHFIDIRTYMLSFGIEDAGLSESAGDKEDIAKGEIPRSLRKDYVHGNADFYRLLAKQVQRRMQYLGYLPMTEAVNE